MRNKCIFVASEALRRKNFQGDSHGRANELDAQKHSCNLRYVVIGMDVTEGGSDKNIWYLVAPAAKSRSTLFSAIIEVTHRGNMGYVASKDSSV